MTGKITFGFEVFERVGIEVATIHSGTDGESSHVSNLILLDEFVKMFVYPRRVEVVRRNGKKCWYEKVLELRWGRGWGWGCFCGVG
jgi:hypothetical protein